MKASIAILTYQRPTDATTVLALVVQQVLEVSHIRSWHPIRWDVVLIDNDPDGSAKGVVEANGSPLARYVSEPVPGIAAARNRALDEAKESDLLIFIDDDERPEPRWLEHMVDTYMRTRAAAVVGAVVSEFISLPDSWVRAGDFFSRRRHPTGTRVAVAATNNMLLDLQQISRLGLRFDGRFGLSGGEDTLFTRRLHRLGGVMVWCDEAVVVDSVAPSRATRRWVLARALSSGNSWSRVGVELAGSRRDRLCSRFLYGGYGAPRLVGGLVRSAYGLMASSPRHQARGLRTVARGLGMILGSLGWVYEEYRRGSATTRASRKG